jgi:hypothetical protein
MHDYNFTVFKWNKNRYKDYFSTFADTDKNKTRIYIPLVGAADSTFTIPPRVQQQLEKLNNQDSSKAYKIENEAEYKDGYASETNTATSKVRKVKLGGLLNDADAKRDYDNDPQRTNAKNKNLAVVISRHPYDLVGMSSGRQWTSCVDLAFEGARGTRTGPELNDNHSDTIRYDIITGTLIAYLIDKDDRGIKNPKARVLIQPYIRTSKIKERTDDRRTSVLATKPWGHPNEQEHSEEQWSREFAKDDYIFGINIMRQQGALHDEFKATVLQWIDDFNDKQAGHFALSPMANRNDINKEEISIP